jgi:5'-3' exonuclease
MKYTHLVIDGNNLFFRSFVEHSSQTIEGMIVYTQSVIQAIARVNELKERFGFEDSSVFILFDNPESKINIRKIITNGEYKHSREKKKVPKELYYSLSIFAEVLKNYKNNFYIVNKEGLEADDLTKPIYDLYKSTNNSFLFISADLDWARNIKTDAHWFNYHSVYDAYTFFNKYGFNPIGNSIQLWKALKGDKSDCIENATPHLPEVILKDILNKYKDVDDLFSNIHRIDIDEKWKRMFKENERQIRINYQLTDFINKDDNNELDYDGKTLNIIECKENIKILRLWYNSLNLELEERMKTPEQKTMNLFKKRKLKRI